MQRLWVTVLSLLLLLLTACSGSSNGSETTETDVTTVFESETFAVSDTVGDADSVPQEMRGVWVATVTNLNYPSRRGLSADALAAELDAILSVVSSSGFNTIFFQVRPASDALYASELFPYSSVLSGVQGVSPDQDFDPLAYLVRQAKPLGIGIYAWINPLRVTTGSVTYPQQDVTMLAETNPARRFPEYTVVYADGKLYYDCGLPEVRALVAEGCREVVANYDVAGVVFDDYFYPYPVSGAVFDDSASYEAYGNGFPLAAWRRNNVNRLVKSCYEAVKEANPECEFGVAPFGIWQNDNGQNGGSFTRGLEAYHSIYCDALAWVAGGYVDFLAPQIYWSFDLPAAPFAVVANWWNDRLAGSGVTLYVSHAAYKLPSWGTIEELERQIIYLRAQTACQGSILYSYAALRDDLLSIRAVMADLYRVSVPLPSDS